MAANRNEHLTHQYLGNTKLSTRQNEKLAIILPHHKTPF